MRDRLKNDKGFTLIEVIAVLVIIAIISAVAISRVTGTDTAKLQAEVDTLKGHLRYAQYLALNGISPVQWGIDLTKGIDPSTGKYMYELITNPGTGEVPSSFSLPGESGSIHYVSKPLTASGKVLFDDWGRPTGSASIGGLSITITAETGFIQ